MLVTKDKFNLSLKISISLSNRPNHEEHMIWRNICKSPSSPNTKMKLGGYGIMSINRIFILWAS